MEIKLTKDAEILICKLYKAYLQGREEGKTKSDAKYFGHYDKIARDIMPTWLEDDVSDTLGGTARKANKKEAESYRRGHI